jgi:hypothetical protein
MIIPSSTHGVIASSRPRVVVAGGGGDVTPNAVNWADVSYSEDNLSGSKSSQQITGINQTITLRVNYTSAQGANKVELYYLKSVSADGPPFFWTEILPENYTKILDGATFTVTNDEYVNFTVYYGASWVPPSSADATVTVTNVTDSNTVLDTFVITVSL